MLTPVTPWAPKKLKSHPPTTAPTNPRMMSRKKPSPDLLTILLPIKPAVFHPTAPARDAVPRCGWGILGALYADGNHPAAAARPGRDTRPGLRRAAFAGGSGGAAGGRVRWRTAAISLGAAGDRYLWPRLHPRRAGWPRLTVTASVATREPLTGCGKTRILILF